jgi:hypothetical protein
LGLNSGTLEWWAVLAPLGTPIVLIELQNRWSVMNEERTGKCLRQVEHIRLHLWHIYSIAVNQVLVATVKFRSDDFNWTKRNSWFSSFLVSTNPPSRKFWYVPQTLEYRINWEMYTPYAGAVVMLLHINGKFTMGKLKSSLLSKILNNKP